MSISMFELFSIGIGPSSSHTNGPMSGACEFAQSLKSLPQTARIQVTLYGSLALTGIGHGTDKAIINGLMGLKPESVDPACMQTNLERVKQTQLLSLAGLHDINFDYKTDLILEQKIFLPKHSNGMRFCAFDSKGNMQKEQIYYSVGGGFIVTDENFGSPPAASKTLPYPFETFAGLKKHVEDSGMSIREIMLANEQCWQTQDAILAGIDNLKSIMQACIQRGLSTGGTLPGCLQVNRRAKKLHQQLLAQKGVVSNAETSDIMNWLNVYAIAVNEENAAGGRIVTAPTNGAAGIIPAIMAYYLNHQPQHTDAGLQTYFLTSAAIGIIYKKSASISGAEMGCQGEVGVAASMAAGGLTAAMGGTLAQIENAAEIAMEHHLGMTCDPVAGLVQIPCIERNAMGAVKAVNASRMALLGEGKYHVTLDQVINTMRETGHDMQTIYKETSQGGLAKHVGLDKLSVNIVEC